MMRINLIFRNVLVNMAGSSREILRLASLG